MEQDTNPVKKKGGEKNNYKKLPGFSNITGALYEIKTTALLFLRALRISDNFHIASNIEGAGSFDDIVLSLKNQTVFIQLKHKDKSNKSIKVNQLIQLNGDYSLLKYYKSYCKIRDEWTHQYFKQCGKFEDSLFVLSTNSRTDEKLGVTCEIANEPELIKEIKTGGRSILLRKNHDKAVYNFFESLPQYRKQLEEKVAGSEQSNTEDILKIIRILLDNNAKSVPEEKELIKILKELESLGNLKDWEVFLSKFYFLSSQASEEQLDDEIKKEMIDVCGSTKFFDNFEKEIVYWWRNLSYFLSPKAELWQNIVQSCVDNISKVKVNPDANLNIQYNEDELNKLRNKLLSNERIIIIGSNNVNFSCLKVLQSLQIKLYVDVDILKSSLKEVLALWKLGSVFNILLVEGWENTIDITENFEKVLKIKDKRLIIVTSNSDDKPSHLLQLFSCRSIQDNSEFLFHQLDESSKHRILECAINFQGNHVILKSLANATVFEMNEILTDDIISDLLNSKKKLEMGKQLTDEYKFYIPRIMTRHEQVREEVLCEQWNKYLVISGASLEEMKQMFPREIIWKYDKSVNMDFRLCHVYVIDSASDFRDICEIYNRAIESKTTNISFCKEDSVHWLQKCENGFLWKSCCGDIKLIKDYFVDTDYVVEYDNLLEIPHKIILIVADPGMGKSTLLSYLALEFKRENLAMLIIKVNLNEFTDYLSQDEPDPFQLLVQAGNFTTEFQKSLFLHQLQNGDTIVLLDGFDEISPHYSEKVINIVRKLSKTNIRSVWITSRPIMREKLEDSLCTVSFTLKPISTEDQTQFLLKFWKLPMQGKCRKFIRELLNLTQSSIKYLCEEFTGNPLHVKLLGEIFQAEAFEYLQTGKINLPPILDLLELYDNFVDKKWEIFCNKWKLDMTKIGLSEINLTLRDKFQETHMICAFIAVHGIEEVQKLSNSEIMLSKYDDFIKKFEAGCRTGIITDMRKGKPIFVHQTVAEYFIATLLHENYINNRKEQNIQSDKRNLFNQFEIIHCIKMNVLNSDFHTVRNFLNRYLSKKYDLHSAILSGDTETVKMLLSEKSVDVNMRDLGGRTGLFLAVLSYTDIHLNVKEILLTLMEYEADPMIEDEIFQWRPLYLGVHIEAWYAVGFLTQWKADYRDLDPIKLKINNNDMCIQEILRTALKYGFSKLVSFMLQNGICTEYHIIDNLEFTLLLLAVKYGQIEITKLLIEYEANIEAWDSAGHRNALLIAAESGMLNIAEILIEHGATVDIHNRAKRTTPLILAADGGHGNMVKLLMQQDISIVHARDKDGNTALHYASASGHTECVSILVDNGANINIKNKKEQTPLMKASRTGHLDVVHFLLHSGADLCAFDIKGNTVLHYAAKFCKNIEFIDYLLNAAKSLINLKNNKGETPLILATINNEQEIVKKLIDHEADPKVLTKYGKSLLHLAVKMNDISFISYLLSSTEIDINVRDNRGRTPLLDAAAYQEWDVVKFLIKNHADPEIPHKLGGSVLYTAVRYANSECVHLLLDTGLNIDKKYDGEYTPLLKAAYWGNFDMVKLLIRRGADVRACNQNGDSILHYAAEFANANSVSFILKADKSIINVRNRSGRSPLLIALSKRNVSVVSKLVKYGADLTVTDDCGDTVIHYAVKYDYIRIIPKALEAGLSINVKNNLGHTPLLIASLEENLDAMEKLISLGADQISCDPGSN